MNRSDLLRHNRDYQLLCAGQGLSLLGTAASGIALPLLVLDRTGSAAWAGAVEAVWAVSLALGCLPAGVLADRVGRRALLVGCELGCAASSAALGLAVLTGQAGLPVLLAAGVLLGLLAAPVNAAAPAALCQVVPERRLATALAVNQVRGRAALLAGPVLGGWLFQLSPSAPFWLDAATFLASALTAVGLSSPLRPPRAGPAGERHRLTAGFRLLLRDRVLRRLTLSGAAVNLAFDGVYLAMVVVTAAAGASGLSVGMVLAMSALGATLGALLVPVMDRLVAPGRLLLVATGVCAVLVTGMGLVSDTLVRAVLLAGCGLAVCLSSALMTAARMRSTPAHLQGRVNSAMGLLFLAAPPLGSALAGLLLERWEPALVFPVFGAVLAVAALLAPRGLGRARHRGGSGWHRVGTGRHRRMAEGTAEVRRATRLAA